MTRCIVCMIYRGYRNYVQLHTKATYIRTRAFLQQICLNSCYKLMHSKSVAKARLRVKHLISLVWLGEM